MLYNISRSSQNQNKLSKMYMVIYSLSSKYIQLSSLHNLDAHDQTCQGMLAIATENSSPTLARPVWRETTWPPMHQTANAPSDAAIVASPEMYAKGSCCVNLLQDVKTCNCSNVIKNHQESSNIIKYNQTSSSNNIYLSTLRYYIYLQTWNTVFRGNEKMNTSNHWSKAGLTDCTTAVTVEPSSEFHIGECGWHGYGS